MSLTGSHKSSGRDVRSKNIGLVFLCKSLDDWVTDSHRVQYAAFELGQFFAFLDTCFFPLCVKSKDLASLGRGTLVARSQVGELVESLLRKVQYNLPFGLDLIREISYSPALPILLLSTAWLVGSGYVSSPLLLLLSLLGAGEVIFYEGFILLRRNLILSLLASCLNLLALVLL